MHKLLFGAAGAVIALAMTAAPPALAKGGPGWKAAGSYPPGYSHGKKLGWGSASSPPGFARGRKKGWHGRS